MSHYSESVPATPRPADWRDQALCRKEDPSLFFPDGTTGVHLVTIEEAKSVCLRCPSLDPCGQWALDQRIHEGVWGGMSEADRRTILRRRTRGIRSSEPQNRPSNMPAASLQEAFERRTIPLAGGHLGWTGTRQITFRGAFYTPKRAAFIADRGRTPVGQVLTMCEVEECVLPAHFTDARERKELGLADPRRAVCGTRAAYQRHVKRGEPIDDACRAANRDADNRLRRTGSTKASA